MKLVLLFLMLVGTVESLSAAPVAHEMYHEMQHGFVLSADDVFGSHLVATGHHSRQAEIMGRLMIQDPAASQKYANRKAANLNGGSYFLFQAQTLDLPTLKAGQVLRGHIVESTVGRYEPKNILIKEATFTVDRVILNIENPFFGE